MRSLARRLHTFFIPQHYRSDEVIFRKTRIFVNTSLITVLFALSYLIISASVGMYHSAWMLVVCALVFAICPWLLKYNIPYSVCTNLYVFMAFSSTFWHAVFDGGLSSAVLPWICVTSVTAILFNGSKNGWFWSIASGIGVAIIGVLQMSGVQFEHDIHPGALSLFITNSYVGLVFIAFLIAWVLEGGYTDSLVKLGQQRQETEWGRLMAEQERQRAQDSERTKQQFLANMSHEIRTPINAMVGLTNILIEKNPSQEQRKYLEVIQKSTDILRVLINDILDLTKLEVGKMQFEQIAFSLKDTVSYIEQSLRHKAESKGLKLTVNYDESIAPAVVGDPTRLSQILTNLLDNAIKFTQSGEVKFCIKKADGNKIKFSVTDTGIGMTKEQQQIIFEPFRQADSGTTRRFGGTGLGLYISKQLVELQKGYFAVESEVDKGSTFTFLIEYPVADSTFIPKKETKLTTEEILRELTGIKVLLVEDNEFNRLVAIETLELKIPHVTIDIAHNGKEAIEKAAGHDIIIMDIHMPVMDGYEASTRIRKELPEPLNKIPIIALSASIIVSDVEKCMEAGMNGFVPKPFSAEELLMALYNAKKGIPFLLPRHVANVTSANGSVTDLAMLRDVCSNEENNIRKYINLYLKSAPNTIKAMYDLLKKKEYKELKDSMHTFKVHLQYMGMAEAGKLAKQIEHHSFDYKDIEEIKPLADKLNALCERSYTELNSYLNKEKQTV